NKNGWWYVENGKVDFSRTVTIDTSMSSQVLTLVNQQRAAAGLSSLSMPSVYQSMATQRALELTAYFSHTRPDGTSCFTVFEDFGVSSSSWGENIAAGQPTAALVMDSWMNTSGHRANILSSSYKYVGIACVKVSGTAYTYYWVQVFGS
ncbi:MAG: CAP domain-containing protein, partial [Lachnospiraceae bacterium]|nr:CAP domain-containing protein [Lachnospiraceae bacterium]